MDAYDFAGEGTRVKARLWIGNGIAAAAIIVVSATPASAGSCTPITTSGSMSSGPSGVDPQWGDSYHDVTTTTPYWSIVADRGSQGATVSTALLTTPATTCSVLEATNSSDQSSRWVALDNNA